MAKVAILLLISLSYLADCFHFEPANDFNGDIWAVLVAGSNTYDNYRHQADVCHAYQVLHEHGVPDSNIIVMMYDDIAYNEYNPRKGVIINEPNGPNVYKGVPKDYTGDEVTPENFLKVLLADEELAARGKKVLKSGPQDHVFVYFSDHGAQGLVAFPNDELQASDLNQTLTQMYQKNSYAKLVFYLEACESGSMFDGLLSPHLNIFATTAANPDESSYAALFVDELNTYVADLYSINWLEDSDKPSLQKETLQNQFVVVRKETNMSHVCEYGDQSIRSLPVSQFQGSKVSALRNERKEKLIIRDVVPAPDVPLEIARRRYLKAKTKEDKRKLLKEFRHRVQLREYLEETMMRLANELKQVSPIKSVQLWNGKQKIHNHECYKSMVRTFDEFCFDVSQHTHALRYLYIFNNFCNTNPTVETAQKKVVEFCKKNLEKSLGRNIV